MYASEIKEESLKLHVGHDFFEAYDYCDILGNIDFAVAAPQTELELFDKEYFLWAEAKQGTHHNIYESFVQLILTIGKARTFDYYLPPKFLGAFDAEKIAFIPYDEIRDVFYQNDFNWNVTPSNHDSKEFNQLMTLVQGLLEKETLLFKFNDDKKLLTEFIKHNFIVGKNKITKTRVTKTNFISVYNRWETEVFPSIDIHKDTMKKLGMVSADFYLADILSKDDFTLQDKLFALLRNDHYDLVNKQDINLLLDVHATAKFKDGGKAHNKFWSRYQRPPKREYWDYILCRRDLLVPQDIRERKGSFFTPKIWVEKSQEYLEQILGENWQDEYYIWDCCAGTGNLLANLSNKNNIWASTLDEPDVKVMREQTEHGLNLWDSHIFQFDFLNDDFSKLPEELYKIITDAEKRRKLIIYINPPYAEAGDAKQTAGTGKNKGKVATETHIYIKYKSAIGKAAQELFAQFIIRIYHEIPSCVLAEFSKLKILQAPNFADFRAIFRAKLEKMFLVPASTFDNVKGSFPIGFFIWDTSKSYTLCKETADVYNAQGELILKKSIHCSTTQKNTIGAWLGKYRNSTADCVGMMNSGRNDFQNQKNCYIANHLTAERTHAQIHRFNQSNLIEGCIYLAVRHCIEATWLNDRDQFLYPNNGWKTDSEFQTDCLVFTLFHGQNRISSENGINHWIPFTEDEIHARDCFKSHFISDILNGKQKLTLYTNTPSAEMNLFAQTETSEFVLQWSNEAQNVMNAGRELWQYYHDKDGSNPNASYYDIRKAFQGTKIDKKGKEVMNTTSTDYTYNTLQMALRQAEKALGAKIADKVYLYGFLK